MSQFYNFQARCLYGGAIPPNDAPQIEESESQDINIPPEIQEEIEIIREVLVGFASRVRDTISAGQFARQDIVELIRELFSLRDSIVAYEQELPFFNLISSHFLEVLDELEQELIQVY